MNGLIQFQALGRLDAFLALPGGAQRRVFLIGPSGAGKSAIRAALARRAGIDWAFPPRFVSRALRADDDPAENVFLPEDRFQAELGKGALGFFWTKPIAPGQLQLYGFPPTSAAFTLYGCNNEFIANAASLRTGDGALLQGLRVYVHCSDEERRRRLGQRHHANPVGEAERLYRIAAASTDVAGQCDLLLLNESGSPEHAAGQLLAVLSGHMERAR